MSFVTIGTLLGLGPLIPVIQCNTLCFIKSQYTFFLMMMK